MAGHLRECAKLDRELRAAAQTRTIFDPEVRRLRAALRDQCEAALLADQRLSQNHDVETLLWKAVYYRPIEEFRRRVKAAEGELRDKTKLAFHVFLEEAKAFYLTLAAKLQQRWGDAGFPAALAAQQLQAMGRELPAVLSPAGRGLDCAPSVHRCLVCLGDLCRYQANALPPGERDWAQCRHFYSLAARVQPEGGNAYNQLAVLASYEGDSLAAAFFYIRALAAGNPFSVARENLVTHFEQNRAACAKLGASGPGGPVPRGQRPASQAAKELRIRCTRLLGTLLTREDLDSFPSQLAAAMADLDDHLVRLRQQGRKAAEAAAADEQTPPLLVQLTAAAIYSAHASAVPAASGSGQPPSFVAAVQQQRVRSLCLLLLFTVTAKLAAAAAAAAEAAPGGLQGTAAGLLLLPSLHVLLLWLSRAGPDVLLPPQQAQQEPADLAAARQQLWQAGGAVVCALRSQQEAAAAALAASDPQRAQQAQQGAALLLPEDAQLAGFQPLERPDSGSVGTSGGSCSGAASSVASTALRRREAATGEAAAAERLRRILWNATGIAHVLAESREQRVPAGLAAAQEAFVHAALPDAGAQLQAAEGQQPQAGEPLPQQTQQQAQQQPQQAQQQQAQQQAEQAMEEDEALEEEVILYAPPPRPAQSPAPAAAPAAAPQQVQQQQQQQAQGGVLPPTLGVRGFPAAAAGAAVPGEAPLEAAAAAAVAAEAPVGMDFETEDALMAQTVEAVAGSVLPEDDRRPSPSLPPLQPAPLAGAVGAAAAQQQHALPAAGAGAQLAAAAVPEGGVQLPPAFFSLLGAAPQQQPVAAVQLPATGTGQQIAAGQPQQQGQITPGPAGSITGSLQAQPQQAAGLRSLLFGGGGGGMQPPAVSLAAQQAQQPQQPQAPLPLPQQLAAPAVSSAGQQVLLSSATPADRWAWMGAFGGGSSAPPAAAAPSTAHAAPAQQQAGGLPLPIPLRQPPGMGWHQQQQQQQQQPPR